MDSRLRRRGRGRGKERVSREGLGVSREGLGESWRGFGGSWEVLGGSWEALGKKETKSFSPYEVVLYVIIPYGGGLRTGRRGGGEEERTVGVRYAQLNPR